jgi:putative ABC transport system ATP-binding protein
MNSIPPTIIADRVNFAFSENGGEVLRDVSLRVEAGEIVAVTGRSGSGKSTLLLCLAGIVVPQSGDIRIDGHHLTDLSDEARSAFRRNSLGFVFQFGELIGELDLLSNISLPLELLGENRSSARGKARELLTELGLDDLAGRRPGEVSGGQAQRAAVARALVHEPAVVLADEPTGALDAENAGVVLEVLVDLVRRRSAALVLVTHDREVAGRADREIAMVDGAVISRPAA